MHGCPELATPRRRPELSRSRNRKPSTGGRIGGVGAPGAGLAISDETDSPLSGAKAVISTSEVTFGSLPASGSLARMNARARRRGTEKQCCPAQRSISSSAEVTGQRSANYRIIVLRVNSGHLEWCLSNFRMASSCETESELRANCVPKWLPGDLGLLNYAESTSRDFQGTSRNRTERLLRLRRSIDLST